MRSAPALTVFVRKRSRQRIREIGADRVATVEGRGIRLHSERVPGDLGIRGLPAGASEVGSTDTHRRAEGPRQR